MVFIDPPGKSLWTPMGSSSKRTYQEEEIEEDVEEVLGQDQRIEAVALVDGVLVVGLQFVE